MLSKGLLAPELRGVIEQHVVPLTGCCMLRMRLSHVCRELYQRLRLGRDFQLFAAIIAGRMNLGDLDPDKRTLYAERCIRFIWPGFYWPPTGRFVLIREVFWAQCRGDYHANYRRKRRTIEIRMPFLSGWEEASIFTRSVVPCSCQDQTCDISELPAAKRWAVERDGRLAFVFYLMDKNQNFPP